MSPTPSIFYQRYSGWIGHATFLMLAILAIIFYQERTILFDAAFQTFEIIKTGWFFFPANRFSVAFIQLLPWLVFHLGGSLKAILLSYSLAWVLFPWLLFVICHHVLQQRALAFSIVCSQVFLVNDTFYWAIVEHLQGLAVVVVFWALLLNRQQSVSRRWWQYPLLVCLLLVALFFHPLLLFPMLFLVGYFGWSKTDGTKTIGKLALIGVGVAYVVLHFIRAQIFQNEYDDKVTQILTFEKLQHLFSKFGSILSVQLFWEHLLIDLYLLPLGLLLLTWFYIKHKAWKKLSWSWAFVLGYLILAFMVHEKNEAWFHLESHLLLVGFFVFLPLLYDVLPAFSATLKGNKVVVWIVVLIFFFRLGDMVQTGSFYVDRHAYEKELLTDSQHQPGTKFLVLDADCDKTKLIQTWTLAYETLFISALGSPDSTRSIMAVKNNEEGNWRQKDANVFHGRFNVLPYDHLPQHLFNFTDTTNPYLYLHVQKTN